MTQAAVRLRSNQRAVMNMLVHGPRLVTAIVNESWTRNPEQAGNFSWDQAHAILRRLEDRGFVRRASTHPTLWELTQAGRKALG